MADWDAAWNLCRQAIALDADDLKAFLDEKCAEDTELRRQVESLLNATDDAIGSDCLPEGLRRLWNHLESCDRDASTRDPSPNDGTTHGILFRSSPFSTLGTQTLNDLLSVMRVREFAAGEFLIHQGDPAEFLLLILTGHASARLRGTPGDSAPVGEFGPGDVVGEISLVADEPRTADVIARTLVRALILDASDFHVLANRHPDLRVLLTEIVTERLGQARHDGLGGKDVNGYQIVECVGRGGMGVVYDARHLATGRRVALKMMNHRLTYHLAARRRFRKEASILATLAHPSLARLYSSFPAYKTEFLAMEFCEGPTLAHAITVRGSLAEPVVRRIVGQLADALRYVHSHGLVHRDVKPSNVVLTRSGHTKLIDFGIALIERDSDLRNALESTSHPAALLGTPRYMAPEQFSDRVVDYRADLYGLACIAFEALTGRPPIQSSGIFNIVREHAHFVMPSADAIGVGVSQEMYEVLAVGLEHDPTRRVLDLDRLASWAGPVTVES
jgi:tRNA A-37 threonylcarbamoyl transferase component Bud32